MCGGYALDVDPEALVRAFRVDRNQLELPFTPEHFPKQRCPIVVARKLPEGGFERVLGAARWGLVPAWAKDPSIGDRLYNARSESLAEKASFKDSFAQRRCIVPASAFYEWQGPKGHKQRFAVRAADGSVLGLAGLWSLYRFADGERLGTFTVITVDANALVSQIHDRMPAVVAPRDVDAWLDPRADVAHLSALLRPAPDGLLTLAPSTPARRSDPS